MPYIDELAPGSDGLWDAALRRTFSIADLVRDENIVPVIARRMLTKEQADLPTEWEPTRVDPPDSSLASVLADAESHVTAFVNAARSGALDLPLSGFGHFVSGGDIGTDRRHTPRESAIEAMRSALPAAESPHHRAEEWFGWLWERLSSSYVGSR